MPDPSVPATRPPAPLLDRVATILEQARTNVVRTVNSQMVIAYWLIGREIVEEEQQGRDRAEYGTRLIEKLSQQLTERYGKGFSVSNLESFRKFYMTYPDRRPQIPYTVCRESITNSRPTTNGFASALSWSHYRLLMRVGNRQARSFYEIEAALFSAPTGRDHRSLGQAITAPPQVNMPTRTVCPEGAHQPAADTRLKKPSRLHSGSRAVPGAMPRATMTPGLQPDPDHPSPSTSASGKMRSCSPTETGASSPHAIDCTCPRWTTSAGSWSTSLNSARPAPNIGSTRLLRGPQPRDRYSTTDYRHPGGTVAEPPGDDR
ncbi:MAG: DUF1016 domain-containing protein [Kiritimatiellaeota bacterium]|nr:DUF1016 domain-containing protein [Kiritimatiellota bacterium]